MLYATKGGVSINYEVEGDGPAFLLLLGITQSIEDWQEAGYNDALRSYRQLLSIDLRGHGHSDKPHNAAAYEGTAMVEDVRCVLDDLGISKTDGIGYSGGAFDAMNIAMSEPERLRSLIIGGSSNKWAGLSDGTRRLLEEGMEVFAPAAFEAKRPPCPLAVGRGS